MVISGRFLKNIYVRKPLTGGSFLGQKSPWTSGFLDHFSWTTSPWNKVFLDHCPLDKCINTKKKILTNVSLDNRVLGQRSPWTTVRRTIVPTPMTLHQVYLACNN